jgi:quinol monooxygenase YgiN
MTTKALFVQLEAKPGKEADVAEFLRSALPIVQQEPGTQAWFAVQFSPGTFAIFDAFPDDDARQAHLNGQVAKALAERGGELFSKAPEIIPADVLADKL